MGSHHRGSGGETHVRSMQVIIYRAATRWSGTLPDTGAHDPCQYDEDGFEGEPIVFRAGGVFKFNGWRGVGRESFIYAECLMERGVPPHRWTRAVNNSPWPSSYFGTRCQIPSPLYPSSPLLRLPLSPHTHTSSP